MTAKGFRTRDPCGFLTLNEGLLVLVLDLRGLILLLLLCKLFWCCLMPLSITLLVTLRSCYTSTQLQHHKGYKETLAGKKEARSRLMVVVLSDVQPGCAPQLQSDTGNSLSGTSLAVLLLCW